MTTSVKASVLISNYNYGSFLTEAVESCLKQTHQNIEVIIVDDGSTDESRDRINELTAKDERVTGVFQENGGQAVALNAAAAKATGDIWFLLDSDDWFHSNYVEEALKVYRDHPECDFLTCGLHEFGAAEGNLFDDYPDRLTDIGYTRIITHQKQLFIGGRTSTNSFSKAAAGKIFPVPHAEDYRLCGDFPIVAGASIAGCRKFYLKEAFVEYRVHDNNIWRTKKISACKRYQSEVSYRLLFTRFSLTDPELDRLCRNPLRKLLLAELVTGNKSPTLTKRYADAIMHHSADPVWKRYVTAIQLRLRPKAFMDSYKARWLRRPQ